MKYIVSGGLGRLGNHYPKTVTVNADTELDASMAAVNAIRHKIIQEDLNGDIQSRILSKIVHITDTEEVSV